MSGVYIEHQVQSTDTEFTLRETPLICGVGLGFIPLLLRCRP